MGSKANEEFVKLEAPSCRSLARSSEPFQVVDKSQCDQELDMVKLKLNESFLRCFSGKLEVKITGVERSSRKNYFLNDNEHIIKAKVQVLSGKSPVFDILLHLYGPKVNHEGNRRTSYCEVNFHENWVQSDVNTAMNVIFDFLIDIGQKRVYFTCPCDNTAKRIIEIANFEGKLEPNNCDDPSLKENQQKWLRILEGEQVLYYARQYLGGKHWPFGSLDHFPLYLPLIETMESKFYEIFGDGFPYITVFSAEFQKNHQQKQEWEKFKRFSRDKILTGKTGPQNIYLACLQQPVNENEISS